MYLAPKPTGKAVPFGSSPSGLVSGVLPLAAGGPWAAASLSACLCLACSRLCAISSCVRGLGTSRTLPSGLTRCPQAARQGAAAPCDGGSTLSPGPHRGRGSRAPSQAVATGEQGTAGFLGGHGPRHLVRVSSPAGTPVPRASHASGALSQVPTPHRARTPLPQPSPPVLTWVYSEAKPSHPQQTFWTRR